MAERERLIQKRYHLQNMLTQGQACMVYLAFDQVLQRPVTVKVIPPEHIAAYKASIRLTAQFSHANIIGTYDFIQEPDVLYLVQEYVDGDTFGGLLRTQLSPFDAADFGLQMCQALLYAGSNTRGVCHGDLTPTTIIRDRRGLIRINDFALPSDMHYFSAWSNVGGRNGHALSDTGLPWGKLSDGRRADDTRAVGLLLYQLLSGRQPGATSVEPPADGRLRFMRNVPVELCEIVARTLVEQHPQHISTPEKLYEELQKQTEALELMGEAVPVRESPVEDSPKARPFIPQGSSNIPNGEKLATALPVRESGQAGAGFPSFQGDGNGPMMVMEPQVQRPQFASTAQEVPFQSQYGSPKEPQNTRRISIPILILFCVLVFIAFFVIGYFIAHTLLR